MHAGWQRKRREEEAGQLERRGFYACCRTLSGLKSIWRPVEERHRPCSELREPLRHGQAANHAFVGASLLAIRACAVPKKIASKLAPTGATPSKVVVALRGAGFCNRSLSGREGIRRPVEDRHRPCSQLREPVRHGSRGSRGCRSQLAGDPRLRGGKKIASKLAPTGDNAIEGSRGAARGGILQSVATRPGRLPVTDGRPARYL